MRDANTPEYSITEAAAALGINAGTLRRWADEGIARPYRLPGRGDRRFSAAEIERLQGVMRAWGAHDPAEEELVHIRDRYRTESLSLPGRCFLCEAFDFSDGRPHESDGTVYYPPHPVDSQPGHAHTAHPSIPKGQPQVDMLRLREIMTALNNEHPAMREQLTGQWQRLAGFNGVQGRVMNELADIAAELIHLRRLAKAGVFDVGV